jgi:hypothetical protein
MPKIGAPIRIIGSNHIAAMSSRSHSGKRIRRSRP